MTEPAAVSAFRTMLLACPTVVALVPGGLLPAQLYYPTAPISPDDNSAGAIFPCGVLAEVSSSRAHFLEYGVYGIPSGTLSVAWYFAVSDIGTIEAFARNVITDLYSLVNGLPIRNCHTELCGAPAGQDLAVGTTRPSSEIWVAKIIVDYGLSG